MRRSFYGRSIQHPLAGITTTHKGNLFPFLQHNIGQIVQFAVDFIELTGAVTEYHSAVSLGIYGILRKAHIFVIAWFHQIIAGSRIAMGEAVPSFNGLLPGT